MNLFLPGFKKGMRAFGEGLGTLVNTAVLLVVYITGIGLTSLVARLFQKEFLELRPRSDSYWKEIDLGRDTKSYYRQF